MKTLATQFDTGRAGTAVATPTCSSCCCCCCCLATVAGSSSLLAQRVHAEGKAKDLMWRDPLTLLAALYWPALAALTYFGYWAIDRLTHSCHGGVNDTWNSPDGSSISCSSSAPGMLVIIIPILAVGILWFLYSRVRMNHPIGRAFAVTAIIVFMLAAEFVVGALLVTAGGPGIGLYLLAVTVAVVSVSAWYGKKLRSEARPPRAGARRSSRLGDGSPPPSPLPPPPPPSVL